MAGTYRLDERALLALERHETQAHAIPNREVRELGDALMLVDSRDPDPFWNRMVSLRWPSDPAAFDRRLTEAIALFMVLARRPHVWPSPDHNRPSDLVARLVGNGFRDVGGGHVMVLTDPARCPPLRPDERGGDTSVERIASADVGEARAVDDVALVLGEAFGTLPERVPELAAELRRTVADERVALVLARVDGQPAAVAKATTFDGATYLSSIGTRPAFRGRGLASLVSRDAVALGREAGSALAYLGVFSGNAAAIRVYRRLGFASLGEAPDLLLE